MRSDVPLVLFVCTGNICRSPAAELLAARAMSGLGIEFASAGTLGQVGARVAPMMGELLRADGLDPSGFAARRLTPKTLDEVDLVLGMTRAHRAAAAEMNPRLIRSVFTLTEFVQLGRAVAESGSLGRRAAADRLSGMVEGAQRHRSAAAASGEIDDPFGRDRAAYQAAYRQISEAIEALAGLVLG